MGAHKGKAQTHTHKRDHYLRSVLELVLRGSKLSALETQRVYHCARNNSEHPFVEQKLRMSDKGVPKHSCHLNLFEFGISFKICNLCLKLRSTGRDKVKRSQVAIAGLFHWTRQVSVHSFT